MHRKTVSFIAIFVYLFLIPISYGHAAPASPTLSSPAANANVSGTSAYLSWNASSGATEYHLWVRRTSDNVVIFDRSVGSATYYYLSGLPNDGKDYFWMVRAGNSSGWSTWATARRFYNGTAAVPAPPALISPAANANVAGASVNLSWNASSGATQYHLWVRRTSDNVVIFNQSIGNLTSYTLTGLPNDGKDYFWMVRAGNSSGWSTWAAARRFYNGTAAVPAPPTLISPAANANAAGTSVNLSWSASSGATQYWLWARRTSDNVVIFSQNVGNLTSYTLTGLPNNGKDYFWMVRAGNTGGWSTWTAARRFYNGTAAVPAPPALISPAANANVAGASVNLSWNASSGATQYHLWVRRTSDSVVIFNQIIGNLTSYTLTGLPNNGKDYFWMVRAGNSSGWSQWTAARRFINGGTSCTYSISPSNGSFPAGGGVKSVSVTASSTNCSWTTYENLSWVSLSPATGTGSRTVTVTVTANAGAARSGLVTIAGKTYTISQAAGNSSGLTEDIEKYMEMVSSMGELSPMVDEITTLLNEIMNGNSSVVTITPPLNNLDLNNLPSSITITANFGNGYRPINSTSVYTGSAVIKITNINVSNSGISAYVSMTATNVKRDGQLILNGGMTLGLNIGVSGSSMTVIANVNFSNLQSLDSQINGGVSISIPSMNIQAGTFSSMTISFNQFTTQDFLLSGGTVKLTPRGDIYDALFNLNTNYGLFSGTVTINNSNADKPVISTTPGNFKAGQYILDIYNVILDSTICSELPVSGKIVIKGSSETKTIMFNNCTYTVN